mgnify:CR=1 FL=1
MSAVSLLAADSMWELFARAVSLRDYNTRVVLLGTTLLGIAAGIELCLIAEKEGRLDVVGELDRIEEARRQTDLKILEIQNFYKFLAVALPPIPPLLVGLIVFVSRRLREREGIAKSRLRS